MLYVCASVVFYVTFIIKLYIDVQPVPASCLPILDVCYTGAENPGRRRDALSESSGRCGRIAAQRTVVLEQLPVRMEEWRMEDPLLST